MPISDLVDERLLSPTEVGEADLFDDRLLSTAELGEGDLLAAFFFYFSLLGSRGLRDLSLGSEA